MKTYLAYFLAIGLFMIPSAYLSSAPAPQFSEDNGAIHGTVYRRGSGQRLTAANVRLVETDQRLMTDADGEFRFNALPAGQYTLTVFASGYRSPEDTVVTVKPGETTSVKIYLERIEFLVEEILVTAQRFPPTVSQQSLQRLDIKRVPGTAGDALRALQVLPGIGVANDFSGELYIRGGAPEDNIFYFDRTPLGYPYHFGGLVSTISSEVIERIDVYAGGFGAEFGADSQAVIDIYSRRGSPEGLSGKFNLNLLYSEGLVEGAIGNRGSWYVSARRSYVDLLPISAENIIAFPRFWDYQAKVSYDLSQKHQLTLNAFAADDFMEFKLDEEDVDNDPTLAGKFLFESGFDGQGIHLKSLLTDRLTSDLSFSRLFNHFNLSFGQGFFLRFQIPLHELREDLIYRLTPKHRLESGLLFTTAPVRVSSFFTRPPDEGDPSFDFTFEEKIEADLTERFRRIEGYLQSRYDPLEFLSIALGLRVDYFNLTDELSIGPRGSVKLKIPSGSEIRFAYGQYDQSPQAPQIIPGFGNPDVKSTQAIHYILEVERQISPNTGLKFAGYYRDLDNLITQDEEQVYLNQGEGFSRGVEVFLNHRSGDRFFGWVSYAYSRSERRDRPEDPQRLYSFDQPHVATLTASYKLTPTWEIGAKWQYSTGNPYTPVLDATLVPHPTTGQLVYVPIYGEVNSARVSPFHRLDIRIHKSFIYDRWQMGVFLEIFNAYNRKNVLDFDYNDDYSDFDVIHQLPIIPYLGVTVEF
ncbi:MAG: TonB-dependent receptor [Candidatus Poribacteria bacterium]|nr:TonB-dependent receptor [Candidatus Poribacteria bacterium]